MTEPSTRYLLLPGQLRMALAVLGLLLVAPAAGGESDRVQGEPDGQQTEPATPQAARPQLKLPGLTVNVAERCVEATPMHIHTALLVLGATNGHPQMRRPRDPAGTGWIDIPPSGDSIKVSLVFQDTEGQLVEHSIAEFVAASDVASNGAAVDGGEAADFPDTFLFAGSHLFDNGDGPRTYLADESGHVISIATFGDELLCIDGTHAHANDALMWQINPDNLPPVGEKVTLRLRRR